MTRLGLLHPAEDFFDLTLVATRHRHVPLGAVNVNDRAWAKAAAVY
jgi:hypothetical protein